MQVSRVGNDALAASIKAVTALLDLTENWNSYHGKPIDPHLAAAAIEILGRVFDKDTPKCQAVPMSSGGVQLEWHQNGVDIEIYVDQKDTSFFAQDCDREEELDMQHIEDRVWLHQLLTWTEKLPAKELTHG